MAQDPPTVSTFPAAFLRAYAEVVAEPIASVQESEDGAAAPVLADELVLEYGRKHVAAARAHIAHLRAKEAGWRRDGQVQRTAQTAKL